MWGSWGLYMYIGLTQSNPKPKSEMGVVETKTKYPNPNVVFYYFIMNTILPTNYPYMIIHNTEYISTYSLTELNMIPITTQLLLREMGTDRWCNPPLTPTYPHNLHLMLKNFTRYNPYYQYNLQNRV